MAKEAKSQIFYIDMGGWNYAWRANKDAYPNDVRKVLGVEEAKDTKNDLIFGANNPKPPKVRLNTASGRSYIRFCNPTEYLKFMKNNSANDEKIYGENINSITTVQG